jgi:hypothetical protein
MEEDTTKLDRGELHRCSEREPHWLAGSLRQRHDAQRPIELRPHDRVVTIIERDARRSTAHVPST